MNDANRSAWGRVEILPSGVWDVQEGMASLRTSVCDNQYVLQIKRISSHSGNIPLRVFTKDGDDEGWSAVVSQIPFHTLDSTWNTVLLYDEDDMEICFLSTDNVAFVQPFCFSEDIEFQVRFFNVSGSLTTSAETILWEEEERYYYTMYPVTSGDCSNQNPDYCCDYYFEADISGTGTEGIMKFLFGWDNTSYDLEVPPSNDEDHDATNCGPILSSWWAEDHVSTNGVGYLEFDCDQTSYSWTIGDIDDVHGVLMDPDGRMCKLTY